LKRLAIATSLPQAAWMSWLILAVMAAGRIIPDG